MKRINIIKINVLKLLNNFSKEFKASGTKRSSSPKVHTNSLFDNEIAFIRFG